MYIDLKNSISCLTKVVKACVNLLSVSGRWHILKINNLKVIIKWEVGSEQKFGVISVEKIGRECRE